MNEYKTRNEVFNSILKPVIQHLQSSNFKVHPDVFVTLEPFIRRIWNQDVNIIENSRYDDVDPDGATFLAVDKFFNANDSIKDCKKPTPTQWKEFVFILYEALSTMDQLKINSICLLISDYQKQLESLENSLVPSYLKKWFKDFSRNICKCLSLLQIRASEVELKSSKNEILLYIIQLTTCLHLLVKLFTRELTNKVLIIESRRFLTKRFIYCFDGVRKVLKEDTEEIPLCGFIHYMDNALDLVATVTPNSNIINIENVKISIEEVLCHAMSIAQISSAEDCKKIKATVQSVLHEFNQLQEECKKSEVNPSVCNLYIDLVSDKLCLLERRVNTTVLNISLKIFSEYREPLQKLRNMCEESDASILQRSEGDLDELVADFDTHVDCIMQVGHFAIACSTNKNIIAKIRSYMASLEALESELVPSLTSLYMEPSKVSCLHATLFVDHWYDEVRKFRNDVCFIIDPLAFSQVVCEEYKTNLEKILQYMSNTTSVLTQHMIQPICYRMEVLILVIKASVADMKLKDDCPIVKQFKKFKDVHNEVCSAVDLLSNNTDRKFSERVLKRLQILSTMINRLVLAFSEDNKNTTNIKEEPKVKSVLADVSNIIKTNETENISFDISVKNLQERGQQLLKERSVLYKTPRKNHKLLPVTPNNLTQSKYSESRKMGFSFLRKIANCDLTSNTNKTTTSMDLQITEILEEITELSNTLESSNLSLFRGASV